jgi:hypothetical protein
MLGFVAAVLFSIAFLIYATSTSTSTVLSPTSFLLAGLACPRSARRRHRHRLVSTAPTVAPVSGSISRCRIGLIERAERPTPKREDRKRTKPALPALAEIRSRTTQARQLNRPTNARS